jgi:hypothetical protein
MPSIRNIYLKLKDHTGAGKPGLVKEDSSEMLLVGEHLILSWQIGTARINEVDTRQSVLFCDFLCTQVLLDLTLG